MNKAELINAAAEKAGLSKKDTEAVSYTHLDVYKRQPRSSSESASFCWQP